MEGSTYAANEERARILRMVEDGVLSATEAITLLDRLGRPTAARTANAEPGMADFPPQEAFEPAEAAPEAPAAGSSAAGGSPQWLRVRVTDLNTGRSKASVSIPFRLASWGLRLGSRFDSRVEGVDLAELSRLLDEGAPQGMLVDVVDDEDGEHVQIFVE